MENKEIILPDPSKLVVSSSPHVSANENVTSIMRDVIIALIPACIAGVVFFGIGAFNVLLLCTLFCVGLEALALKMLGKDFKALKDGSAIVTGLLLGMNLSSNTPWWICLIGSGLAIVLAKHLYGGLGYNPFNPALVGRVGLLIAFPAALTSWPTNKFASSGLDAVTSATPLDAVCSATIDPTKLWRPEMEYMDYFVGNIGGCIGETSAIALLLGGIYLIYRKLIRWQVPVFYILTVAIITGIMYLAAPTLAEWGVVKDTKYFATPLFHILTGGLMLGAFFMATDMVTSPVTVKGSIIFAIGCGLITSVIRIWGSYPEGVSFSILFMNAFVPLIDRISAKKVFGSQPKTKEA